VTLAPRSLLPLFLRVRRANRERRAPLAQLRC